MKYKQILSLLAILFIAGCSSSPTSCPSSCDDGISCTIDYCSNETNFVCIHNITYLTPILEDDMSNDLSNWNDVYKSNAWKVSEGVIKTDYVSIPNSIPPYLFASGINAFKGDYAITGKFKLEEGVFVIIMRLTDFKGYSLWLMENMALLMKVNSSTPGTPPTALSLVQTPITNNVWLNFKVITVGAKIIVYLEDKKIIDIIDNDELLPSGNFGFSISSQVFDNVYDKVAVEIDDVRIYEVNSSNYQCI
jgi:hypothetical protein